jgi:hypothetical protein
MAVASFLPTGVGPAGAAPNPDFKVLAQFRLPNTAADWTYAPVTVVGSTVFIADDSRIYTMGVDQLALDDTLTLPSTAGTVTPTAAASLGGKAFFAYRSRQVVAVDAVTKAITVIPAVCGTGARILPWITTHGDRVYVGCHSANFVARIDPVTLSVDDTFATGSSNMGMTVIDDTAYVANDGSNSVTPVNLRTDPPAPAANISVGSRPHGIASFDDTVFVANYFTANMSLIRTRANPPSTSTVSVGSSPVPVVSCGTGIYTARRGTSEVMYVNPVTSAVQSINSVAFSDPHALAAYSGQVWTLSVNARLVGTINCATRTVDDSLSLSADSGNPQFIAFSPYRAFITGVGGPNGSLAIIQTGVAPQPPVPPVPPTPASAPLNVMAIAGDGSATLSWSPPESAGSYAVSHYEVTSSPGGRTCLVAAPALSCAVEGLSNGTAYTFTVKALTGAGWSTASDPSTAVTPRAKPRPTLVIAGSRDGGRIAVSGSTTGMAMGGLVTPWTSRSLKDFISRAAILVSADGTFAWSRRASGSVVWRVYFTAEEARSNTITIR